MTSLDTVRTDIQMANMHALAPIHIGPHHMIYLFNISIASYSCLSADIISPSSQTPIRSPPDKIYAALSRYQFHSHLLLLIRNHINCLHPEPLNRL